MSFDSLMRDTCILLERTAGAVDDTNKPVITWTAVETLRCRVEREDLLWDNTLVTTLPRSVVLAIFIFFFREPVGHVLNEDQFRLRWTEHPSGKTLDLKIMQIMKRDDYGSMHHLEVRAHIPDARSEY